MTLDRWDDAPRFVAADLRVIIKTGGDPFNLVHVFDERLAAFARQQHRDLFAPFAYLPRHSVQQLALLNARRPTPISLRRVRSTHGLLDVFGAGARHFIKLFLSRRILNDKRLAREACDKLAVDEHLAHLWFSRDHSSKFKL